MFCTKCGTNIPDTAAFCPTCGNPTAAQPAQPTYQQPAQPTYQQPAYQQPTYQQPAYQQPTQPAYPQTEYNAPADKFGNMPMKWYKFLIYFSLFAGAVFNVINAVRTLSGSVYNGAADMVYAYYEGLQLLDIFFSVGCIALAAFSVYVRFRLAGLKQNAPQLLNYLYIATLVISLIYNIGALVVTDMVDATGMGTVVGSVIGNVIMLAINNTYFGKRKHLFINP